MLWAIRPLEYGSFTWQLCRVYIIVQAAYARGVVRVIIGILGRGAIISQMYTMIQYKYCMIIERLAMCIFLFACVYVCVCVWSG